MTYSNSISERAEIVEVGPRDGFQAIGPFIPTEDKKAIITRLHAAGIRRMEVTSFVSEAALPQMADAADVLAYAQALEGLDCQVLVPSVRHAQRALDAGADHIAFVLSVSEAHNMGNVRRTPDASVEEFAKIMDLAPSGTKIRVNVATAFDCPHQGRIETDEVLRILEKLVAVTPDAEFALCDTTGKASPPQIADLFHRAKTEFFDGPRWAFHGHDTYGLGTANVWSAWDAGVRVFDAAIAGVGGCPYAPGAKGNVATEDVIWLFEQSGIDTGVTMTNLLLAANDMEQVPGADLGGRVREALPRPAAETALSIG